MLSDERRAEIREEELLRADILRELEAARQDRKSRKEKAWALLNTGFALWFLSTVLVGIVTFTYSRFDSNQKERLRQRAVRDQLDQEIAARLMSSSQSLDALAKRLEGGSLISSRASIYDSVLRSLGSDGGIFKEYDDRNFPSLAFALQPLVSPKEAKEIAGAILAYQQLRQVSESGSSHGAIGQDMNVDEGVLKRELSDLAEARSLVEKRIWLRRWRR